MNIPRTIQNVFDDQRENKNKIEKIKNQLEDLKNELKKLKNRSKELKKEEKELRIDLIKEKKIKWIESDLNSWRDYIEKNNCEYNVPYYIYYYEGSIQQQGYFAGKHQLSEKEYDHFENYIYDYFYYGSPNYQDHNDPNDEVSECNLAFGNGNAYIKLFTWN